MIFPEVKAGVLTLISIAISLLWRPVALLRYCWMTDIIKGLSY